MISALLALEDGTIFSGKSIGANGATSGEVVFNTAMTGYQEILTDPSYFKQLVTLTYPTSETQVPINMILKAPELLLLV